MTHKNLSHFSPYHQILFFSYSRLSNGGEFLLQAQDDADMSRWVNAVTSQCGGDVSGMGGAATLPAPSSSGKDEPKRRSFFTLKKK